MSAAIEKAKRIEAKARELAVMNGGKIIMYRPGEGGCTLAYLTGKREGWWKYGRGVFNGDCVELFADRNWQKYVDDAKAALAGSGAPTEGQMD